MHKIVDKLGRRNNLFATDRKLFVNSLQDLCGLSLPQGNCILKLLEQIPNLVPLIDKCAQWISKLMTYCCVN